MKIVEATPNKNASFNIVGNNSKLYIADDQVTKTFNQRVKWSDAANWTKLSEANHDSVVQIHSLVRNNMQCVGFTYPYEYGETARFFLKFNFNITERRYICNILIKIYQKMLARQTVYVNWDLDSIIIGDEIKLASPNSLRRISKKEASQYPYTNDFLLVLVSILYGFDFKNELIAENEREILLSNVQKILASATYPKDALDSLMARITDENINDFKLARCNKN